MSESEPKTTPTEGVTACTIFTVGSHIDRDNPNNGITFIYQHRDEEGNVFYNGRIMTHPMIPASDLGKLRDQIVTQGAAFSKLPDDEQARIREEYGSSNRDWDLVKPFVSFLQSEVLGKRYSELEENYSQAK